MTSTSGHSTLHSLIPYSKTWAGAVSPYAAGKIAIVLRLRGGSRSQRESAEATTAERDLKSIGFDMQATLSTQLGSKSWPGDPVLAANVGQGGLDPIFEPL